jgi:ABC-2 type transport system permease protein
MFGQIFLFELKYRLRRPAVYIYFLVVLIFPFIAFANGFVPVQEKEFINSPASLALYSGVFSIFLMLVSSSIMGVPLYRDIEHNTRDYYLSYPITKPGYFWGRFLGSFFFMLLIGAGIFVGAYIGTLAGPAFGWTARSRYESFHFYHYLYPFLTVVVPDLFFTSALFFGLVAVFRNVKVIYSSGIFLFLGYIIGNFFLQNTSNTTLIYLWDPFGFTGLRASVDGLPPEILNSQVIPVRGLLLENRILWTSIGAATLLVTYFRFSFERFFSAEAGKGRRIDNENEARQLTPGRMTANAPTRDLRLEFTGSYPRRVLYTLTRIEILNIVRDNYFWIILSGGLSFLTFLFWNGPQHYGVHDFPRTSFLMNVYAENFGFFLFFILMFYTGETVHRERLTRFAFINDALPPPNWLLGCAKVLSLLALAVFLAVVPMLLGLPIQLLQGYPHFEFPVYFTGLFAVSIPKLFEMVLFCYTIQVIVNNKFAGYGIGIAIWVLQFLGNELNYFTYLLLLYGNTPFVFVSGIDGLGHMFRPLSWFNGYWLLVGSIGLVVAALFFHRGTPTSLRERLQLARERWRGRLRVASLFLLSACLVVGSYIYYNVSVLNAYLTPGERFERRALTEKQLKKYERLPTPTITRVRLEADLFPERQEEWTRTWITVINNTAEPIDTFLLDGDNLENYTLTWQGKVLPYTCPLFYARGEFDFLRPAKDSSDYRMYILPNPMLPGDTAIALIRSLIGLRGFRNEAYGFGLLHHMTAYSGGTPGLGYDDDEEIRNGDKRKKYGLAPRIDRPIPHSDSAGILHLDAGAAIGLSPIDETISTSSNQWVVGQGRLEKEWRQNGRHYFHYVDQTPGIYPSMANLSAPYQSRHFDVAAGTSSQVRVGLYCFPGDTINLWRIQSAVTDGLRYMVASYGPYPFGDFSVAETSIYSDNAGTLAGFAFLSERNGWSAHFKSPEQTDYLYQTVAEMLAGQWWGQQVAPNHTAGSTVIPVGLSRYCSWLLMEKKFGEDKLAAMRRDFMQDFIWSRLRNFTTEHNLLEADDWSEYTIKAPAALYGLRDLIGEDKVNAALKDFYTSFAFRNPGPYAGTEDLYKALQKQTPDSFRYYLTDTWEKVCLYDNRMLEVKASPAGKDRYEVTLRLSIAKTYADSARHDHPATGFNDYIDIGVYDKDHQVLYLKKWRLTAGEHQILVQVKGKPAMAMIDPKGLLIDRNPNDNRKDF